MRNGFNASVPARKPKTKIGRILTELTSDNPESEADSTEDVASPNSGDRRTEGGAGREAGENAMDVESAASVREVAASDAPRDGAGYGHGAIAPSSPRRPSTSSTPVGGALSGRDRLASLRERLSIASRPRSIRAEPNQTATAVRELIQDLRARLESEIRERTEISSELEETRHALVRAESELERQRRSWTNVEARAEECSKVADEAVAEAEALAAERDLVLGELAERRVLDDEQANLLAEAETALERHAAEREAAAQEISELRDLVEIRVTEIADLEARLRAEASGRARVESRCRELEEEVTRLAEAMEAIKAIEAMVERRR